MDNMDDSVNNPKVSDSAYSNSCSNSHSRSHSSKSTHSGSSGSSGYGGKLSTSGSSIKLGNTSKKDNSAKKRKLTHTDKKIPATVLECNPPEPLMYSEVPKEEIITDLEVSLPLALPEKAVENLDTPEPDLISLKHEIPTAPTQTPIESLEANCNVANDEPDGFSCAISIHDGVVAHTSQNLTTCLGFPNQMWIGRSFIDFVHPKDSDIFASQIRNGLSTSLDGKLNLSATGNKNCPVYCRIRKYRGLSTGFAIKEKAVTYLPCLLKFSFKDNSDDDGNVVYLIIKIKPVYSIYKSPNECVVNAKPFIIKHNPMGRIEYADIESVSYLGYLPQDIQNQDALLLYHPDDLPYLKMIYELIVKEGKVSKSIPYKMLTHNGDYVKLETEWSSFVNPWSMKLEFIIAKHQVVEGPTTPNVFLSRSPVKVCKTSIVDEAKTLLAKVNRESILQILKDAINKPARKSKEAIAKRSMDLVANLFPDQKAEVKLRDDSLEPEINAFDRDSEVMSGGISPHSTRDSDCKSNTGTLLNYNQLNFNENLQRYFDSHQNYCLNDDSSESASDQPQDLSIRKANINAESNDMGSSSAPAQPILKIVDPPETMDSFKGRLTESLLTEHNSNMQRNLVRFHLEARAAGTWKGERYVDLRQKQFEHLARCEASFLNTLTTTAVAGTQQGIKRAISMDEVSNKQQCTEARKMKPLPPPGPPMTRFEWEAGYAMGQDNTNNHCRMGPEPQIPAAHMPTLQFPVLQITPPQRSALQIPAVNMPAPQIPTVNMPAPEIPAAHMSASLYPAAHMAAPQIPAARMAAPLIPVADMAAPQAPAAHMPAPQIPAAHNVAAPQMPAPHISASLYPAAHMAAPQISAARMAAQLIPAPDMAAPQVPAAHLPVPEIPAAQMAAPQTPAAHMAAPQIPTTHMPALQISPAHMPALQILPAHMPAPQIPPAHMPAPQIIPADMPAPQTPPAYMPAPPFSALHFRPPLEPRKPVLQIPAPLFPSGYPMFLTPADPESLNMSYAHIPVLSPLSPLSMAHSSEPSVNSSISQPLSPFRNNSARRQPPHGFRTPYLPPKLPAPVAPPALRSTYDAASKTIELPDGNFSQVCRVKVPPRSGYARCAMAVGGEQRHKRMRYSQLYSWQFSNPASSVSAVSSSSQSGLVSDGTLDKSDSDSSYASSNSLFKKPDGGSDIDNGDKKEKKEIHFRPKKECMDLDMEFNYQIKLRPIEEILAADLEKIKKLKQSVLVNRQLGQLYTDLQLEGVTARLTLEEGITSSSGSGDDASLIGKPKDASRRKREFNKVSMIHEENAALPPITDISNKFIHLNPSSLPDTSNAPLPPSDITNKFIHLNPSSLPDTSNGP